MATARFRIGWIGKAALLLYPLLGSAFGQAKPNLLFLIADQVRFDAMGRVQEAQGLPVKSRIRTPNLDRLSRQGAWFRNAYTHSAVCGPSRTAILTGRTMTHTGVTTNAFASERELKAADPAAFSRLSTYRTYDMILARDHGYKAEFYGKWHSPELLGWVYDNEVRMASGPPAWFGKVDADGRKLLSAALQEAYLDTLKAHAVGPTQAAGGQLLNSFTRRAYLPDPLDSRYGNPDAAEAGQPDQHGRDLMAEQWSSTAVEGRQGLEALRRLGRGTRPFSLTVSFHSPHAPMIPSAKYHGMYGPADMQVSPSLNDPMDNSAYRGANGMGARPEYRDPAKVKRWMANYYGLVTEVDAWIGSLLDELRASGLEGNTLVVFLSDHGEMLGAHGLREKNVFLEESARIPLLMCLPGAIPAGAVVDAPVTTLDLHSTILDYLGVDAAAHPTDGATLRPLIEAAAPESRYAVTQWDPASGGVPVFLIRDGDWKLMLPNRAASTVSDMLFDLSRDPYEMANLLGTRAGSASEAVIGKAEGLRTLLADYLAKTGHPLAGEARERRTWPAVRLWASDTAIGFAGLPAAGPRAARLLLGTASGGDVRIRGVTLEGTLAARFAVDWAGGVIPSGGARALRIEYRDPGAAPRAGFATLRIEHDAGGAARIVRLTVTAPTPAARQRFGGAPGPGGAGFAYSGGRLSPRGLGGQAWRVTILAPTGAKVGVFRGQGGDALPVGLPPGLLLARWETASGLQGTGTLVVNR